MRCILAHESYHVSHNHTYDLLAARLLCCGAWFNPFAWLIMREIRTVHEFQADAASIGACGREDYLHLLYRQVTGTGYGHITNNFQSINIKKRIVMMNKMKTRFGAWKVLAALPVAVLLLMVGCKQKTTEAVADEEVVTATAPSVEPEIIKDSLPDGLEPPTYPGGEAALYKYIAENIHYPEQAKADGVEGKVYVRFSVTEDGSIVNAYVARGVGGECDEEALRVIKAMPKWIPAKYEGKRVAVEYVVPIVFKLQ
jgi:TonB family protein